MRQIFERIYATNEWRFGSGEGSLPVHTRPYVAFLQRFLAERRIRTVVDFGCGDWQFSRLVDWSGVEYDGYDVAAALIERNRRAHGRPGVRFHLATDETTPLPRADLLLCKDVLQHWSYARIRAFLPRLADFPHALITNSVSAWGATPNHDIPDGQFRRLDLNAGPFSLGLPVVLTFTNHRPWPLRFLPPRWKKRVLHSAR